MRSFHNNAPDNKGCNKGTINSVTRRRYLLRHWRTPATMLMIDRRTGIMRSSITRLRQELTKAGLLIPVEKRPCKITGRKAVYYVASEKVNPL